jgi:Terminase RNaseH-like domain/Terminase large subunit, T4likevirus-type, N-terminal
VAPSYKVAAVGWRQLRGLAVQVPGADVSAADRRCTFPGGGWLQVRSADNPDSLRGEGLDRVVMDECAFIDESAWTEAIRPSLTDRKGDALFISTPSGHNWFWGLWNRGDGAGAEPGWASFRFPSVSNPHLDPAEVEEARRQLPERTYEQEYNATFLDSGGGVFRGVREAIDAGRRGPGPRGEARTCVAGADLATHEDFTVVTVVELSGPARDGAARQVYLDRVRHVSWARIVAAITAATERYGCPVVVDSTGVGDPVFEQLRKAGVRAIPYVFTSASKAAAVENLALMLERGRLRLQDEPVQTAELLAYRYELTQARHVRTSAPPGTHDDTVMALALACWPAGAGRHDGGFLH